MTISDIIREVKEENLSREKLEQYYSTLVSLFGEMSLEFAEKEKQEARFLDSCRDAEGMTAIMATRIWNAQPDGQRKIDLKHQIRICEKLISATKHRIFNQL